MPILFPTFVNRLHLTHDLTVNFAPLRLIVWVVQKVVHLCEMVHSLARYKLRFVPIVQFHYTRRMINSFVVCLFGFLQGWFHFEVRISSQSWVLTGSSPIVLTWTTVRSHWRPQMSSLQCLIYTVLTWRGWHFFDGFLRSVPGGNSWAYFFVSATFLTFPFDHVWW